MKAYDAQNQDKKHPYIFKRKKFKKMKQYITKYFNHTTSK